MLNSENGSTTPSPATSAPKAVAPKVSAAKGPKAMRKAPTAKARAGAKPAKAKPGKPDKAKAPKRMSALDAAAKVLSGSSKPMRVSDLITQMKSRGLWKSPKGKTPQATLYASIIREIGAKKKDARFRKTGRGLFVTGKGA